MSKDLTIDEIITLKEIIVDELIYNKSRQDELLEIAEILGIDINNILGNENE